MRIPVSLALAVDVVFVVVDDDVGVVAAAAGAALVAAVVVAPFQEPMTAAGVVDVEEVRSFL